MTLQKLKNLRETEKLIREIDDEIAELNGLILPGNTYEHPVSPSGNGGSRVESFVLRKAALEDRLNQQREEYGKTVLDVYEYISGVEDAEIRTILRLKYIKGYSWTKIATEMGRADMADARTQQFWRWAHRNLEDCSKNRLAE